LFDFEFELRETYLHESEFTGYEKSIEDDENDGNEYTDDYSKTGVRVHSSVLYRDSLLCNTR
jgi:hypothetical protein